MLPTFENIVVPVDFTAKNEAALDIAFTIAQQNRGRVALLHVIEVIDNVPQDELTSFYERLTSRAEKELKTRSQRFRDAGLTVESKIRRGKRLKEIVDDAWERKADLVVVSSHKVDPSAALRSLGTLSYQVSVLCPCAVLLVK
jgi:nucleotide-binding universal stress UspA family protein